MTALFTLAATASSETNLVRQEHKDVGYAGRWLLLSPTA
jgi:hypothetical protein